MLNVAYNAENYIIMGYIAVDFSHINEYFE